MKNYQLEINYRDNVKDTEKAILEDYWNLSSGQKPKEIARKHNITDADLKYLVKFQADVLVKGECSNCDKDFRIKVTSRADLALKVGSAICELCLIEKLSSQKAERERIIAERVAEQKKEEEYFQTQEEIRKEKMAMAMEKETWLNLDDDGILILRQLYKTDDFYQLGRKNYYYGNFSNKMKLYLDVFDKLGLIHLQYRFDNPEKIQKVHLNNAVFPNLYLTKRTHNELSIHLKKNESTISPTAPVFRNTIVFDTIRVLEPHRAYLCGLWELPDGSMNLKITPADQIVKRAEEIE